MNNNTAKKTVDLKTQNYRYIKILGSNIFKLRKRNNLSQKAMAKMLGGCLQSFKNRKRYVAQKAQHNIPVQNRKSF